MRLQSIHDEILNGIVPKLKDNLLSVQSIADVKESDYGLQGRELYPLFLVI